MARKKTPEEPFLLSMLPFAGLLLLLALGLVWNYLPQRGSRKETPAELRAKVVIDAWKGASAREVPVDHTDFVLGPADALVTIVEFSDFQCPYCRSASEELRAVRAAHPENVRLVFKNFPLDRACNKHLDEQLHPLACRAAAVALCAGKSRGEFFWKAHDLLFTAPQITEELLARIPRELGLPAKEFESCVASRKTRARIEEDLELGRKLSVKGTPTFFVNGRRAFDYRDGALLRLAEHILSGGGES